MNSAGLRESRAFNTGKVFEAAQVYTGIGVSPIFFLSRDTTLIGKGGGAHPMISEPYIAVMMTLIWKYKFDFQYIDTFFFLIQCLWEISMTPRGQNLEVGWL